MTNLCHEISVIPGIPFKDTENVSFQSQYSNLFNPKI